MENKLQELTEKIYAEGVQKAEEEAGKIREEVKKEAAEIREKANKEAEKIISEAKKKAEDFQRNVEAELKLSSNQALSAVKQKISDLITLKAIDEPVHKAYQDIEFIRNLIETLIKNWSSSGMTDEGIILILPEKSREELEKYLLDKQHEFFKGELKVVVDEKMENGFKIGPADGSYKISFTEEDFSIFIKEYLKPRTNQLLFGDK